MTALEVLVELASTWHGYLPGPAGGAFRIRHTGELLDRAENVQLGLPFMPLSHAENGAWRFWCPLLGRDGRCTDYENRPALCRTYQSGEDALCAEWVPPPAEPDVWAKDAFDPD